MKKKYEAPVLEVFSFEVEDSVMKPCSSDCLGDGGDCPLYCLMDRQCTQDASCIDF